MPYHEITKKSYDTGYFNRIHEWSLSAKYESELEALATMLNLTQDDLVLDIGCGTGNALSYISENKRCQIIGIDFSPDGLRRCGMRERVIVADAHYLPFRDSCFDKAYLMHSIGHVMHSRKVLSEIRRVMKPSGKVGVVTPNRAFICAMKPLNYLGIVKYIPDPTVLRYYSPSSLRRDLEISGFIPLTTITFGKLPTLVSFLSYFKLGHLFRERIISTAKARH